MFSFFKPYFYIVRCNMVGFESHGFSFHIGHAHINTSTKPRTYNTNTYGEKILKISNFHRHMEDIHTSFAYNEKNTKHQSKHINIHTSIRCKIYKSHYIHIKITLYSALYTHIQCIIVDTHRTPSCKLELIELFRDKVQDRISIILLAKFIIFSYLLIKQIL